MAWSGKRRNPPTTKACSHCQRKFSPSPRYPAVRLCPGCYKNREYAFKMWTPVMRELATMKLQVRALERELARYEGKIRPQKPSPRLNGSIPDEILKRMIRLCHPDKHDSSEMATKVTQWLLEQK